MDLERLRDLINHDATTLSLLFTRKISNNHDFISYRSVINDDIHDNLCDLFLKYVNQLIDEDAPLAEYNPTGKADGTYETLSVNDVKDYDKYQVSLDRADANGDLENEADNLTFYTIILNNSVLHDSYKLIRRVTKFKRLYTKGLVASFRGQELNRINSKMIGLDGQIDIIQHENDLLLMNHISIERVFFMDDAFTSKATEMLALLKEGNYLINFDGFEETCLNDKRIQKTITKMANENINWGNALENFDDVISTIDMFDLGIDYNNTPNNALIFERKEQVMPILNLVRDSYYKTLINNHLGTDNKLG